jgi:hypothetical protein
MVLKPFGRATGGCGGHDQAVGKREAMYALEGGALLDFTHIEHLDVWIEEGWLDARTHNPVDMLAVKLAPGVRLELKYVAGNG